MSELPNPETLRHVGKSYRFYNIDKAAQSFGLEDLSHLPFSIRILIENMLRHHGEDGCSSAEIEASIRGAATTYTYHPARVLLQDLLGTPMLIDFAAMRDAVVELDQSKVGRLSRMDAMQAQAMAKASGQRREAMLRNIEVALKRIDDGDYGLCRSCDEPINPKRLEFDPTALRCIECESKREGS